MDGPHAHGDTPPKQNARPERIGTGAVCPNRRAKMGVLSAQALSPFVCVLHVTGHVFQSTRSSEQAVSTDKESSC